MAAEYLQLPLDEVYFVEVEHGDWGDSYVFARKGEYHSCAVQVPGLRVYQGSLPSAWSPPREAIPLLPLTAEAALEVGRVFVTDSLRLDARSLKDVSKPYRPKFPWVWYSVLGVVGLGAASACDCAA